MKKLSGFPDRMIFDDIIGKENPEFTEKDWKRIHKLLKRLTKKINTITYTYGDITITVIKQKKKPKFMTKKEMKALAKMDAEHACESLGLNRKKVKKQ